MKKTILFILLLSALSALCASSLVLFDLDHPVYQEIEALYASAAAPPASSERMYEALFPRAFACRMKTMNETIISVSKIDRIRSDKCLIREKISGKSS